MEREKGGKERKEKGKVVEHTLAIFLPKSANKPPTESINLPVKPIQSVDSVDFHPDRDDNNSFSGGEGLIMKKMKDWLQILLVLLISKQSQ